MFRFLCKADSFDEKQRIVGLLDENSVKYRVKSSGPNIFQRAGYEKKCVWFRIYVDRTDFLKASQLVR